MRTKSDPEWPRSREELPSVPSVSESEAGRTGPDLHFCEICLGGCPVKRQEEEEREEVPSQGDCACGQGRDNDANASHTGSEGKGEHLRGAHTHLQLC